MAYGNKRRVSYYNPKFVDKPFGLADKIDDSFVASFFAQVSDGDIDKIRAFVSENNSSINLINSEGKNLLHIILENEFSGLSPSDKYYIISYLIANGVAVDKSDNNGRTPLHIASQKQLLEIVNLLLDNGANPNSQDQMGMTPLHYSTSGVIDSCKPIVKSVPIVKDKQNFEAIKEKFSDLNLFIKDIISKSSEVKRIDNVIKNYFTYFPEEKDSLKKDLEDDVSRIINNTSISEKEQKKLLEHKTKITVTEIENKIKARLNKSLSDITIVPNPRQSREHDISNMLNYDGRQKYLKEEGRRLQGIVFEQQKIIDDRMKQFKDEITKTTSVIDECLFNIKELSYINQYVPDVIRMDDFNLLLHIGANKLIVSQEINIRKIPLSIADANALSMFPTRQVEIIRGSQEDVANWQKNRTIQVQPVPIIDYPELPIDPAREIRGPNPTMIDNFNRFGAFDPYEESIERIIDPDIFVGPDGNDIVMDTVYGNRGIHFMASYKYAVDRINVFHNSLENIVNKIKLYVEDERLSVIYDKLISEAVFNILNICQYLSYISVQKESSLTRLSTLKTNATKIYNDNKGQNYGFMYDQMTVVIDKFVNKLQTFHDEHLPQIYRYCLSVWNFINSTITSLNNKTSLEILNIMNTMVAGRISSCILNKLYPLTELPTQLSTYVHNYVTKSTHHTLTMPFTDKWITELYNKYVPRVDSIRLLSIPREDEEWNDNLNNGIIDIDYDNPMAHNGRFGFLVNHNIREAIITGNNEYPEATTDKLIDDLFDRTDLLANNPAGFDPFIDAPVENFAVGIPQILADCPYNPDNLIYPIFASRLDDYINLLITELIWIALRIGYDDINNNPIDNPDLVLRRGLFTHDQFIALANSIKDKMGQNEVVQLEKNKIFLAIFGKMMSELLKQFLQKTIQKYSINFANELLGNNQTIQDALYTVLTAMGATTGLRSAIDINIEPSQFIVDIRRINQKYLTNALTDDIESIDHMSVPLDDHPSSEQIIIPSAMYNINKSIGDLQCFKIKPEIIDTLLAHGASPNIRNNEGNIPLATAIEYQHIPTISKLIKAGSIIENINAKYSSGDPIDKAISLFQYHNQFINSKQGLYYNLTFGIKDSVEQYFISDKKLYNNQLKDVKYMGDLLIYMLSCQLSSYLIGYDKDWTYENEKQLEELMKRNRFAINTNKMHPILTLTDDEVKQIIDQQLTIDTLNKFQTQESTTIKVADDRKTKLQSEIESLISKINELTKISLSRELNPSENSYLLYLNKRKDIAEREYASFLPELPSALPFNKTEIMNDYVDEISTSIENISQLNIIQDNIKSFRVFPFIENGFVQFLESIQLNILKLDINDSYALNKMIMIDINNINDSEYSPFHIHPSLVFLQTKLLNSVIDGKLTKAREEFAVMNKLYTLFKNEGQNYFEFDKYYSESENYVLTYALDSIRLTIGNTICSSIYNIIIKIITEYYLTINKENYDDVAIGEIDYLTRTIRGENVRITPEEFARIITNKVDENKRLKNYMITELPKLSIKTVLKIYESEIDEDALITDTNDILEIIIDILCNNPNIRITKDSKLIINIRNNIFPILNDMLNTFIPKLKNLSDNYFKLLLNESKHVEVLNKLLNP